MKLTATLALALAWSLPAQNQGISLVNTADGYLEVPYSPAVVPQSGITVEAWITYDGSTLPTGWRYPTICRQNLNGGQESFFLRIDAHSSNSKTLSWLVNTPVGARRASWNFNAGQLKTWTHVAGTYDGQTARLIVNGAEVANVTAGGALVDQGGVLRIGKGSDVGSPMEVWNGDIDEFRLWPFARTAGEIASTMNLELTSIPGGVSTWNLNSDYKDSSSSLDMTMSGSVNWTSTTTKLTKLLIPAATPNGKSSPGCFGAIQATVASVAQVGNQDFGMIAHRLPANASAIAFTSFAMLAAPINLVGIDIWVDPFVGVGVNATVDSLGTARLTLPIPQTVPVGVALAFQFIVLDPCGKVGLTASDAILIIAQ